MYGSPIHSVAWLATQVSVNTAEGLKRQSAIQCDGMVSLPISFLGIGR
jgi:hypothetical protein